MGTEVLETEALPRIVDAGRLSQAAKLHNEVAEMMESEGAYEEAIRHFTEAADLFVAENASSTALKCVTRVAHLSAQLDPPDYARAAEMFERVGTESLSSNLLKFGAKSAFFNAVICTLARGDVVSGERDLERFKELDYTFPGCREAKLLEDVVAAWKDMNSDAFTDAVFNYDSISKLDPWRTTCVGGRGRGGLGGACSLTAPTRLHSSHNC
jgi:alpha-soluble NSF attachment protein